MKNKKNSQARKVSARATNVRKPSQIKVASVKTKPASAMKKPPRISQKKMSPKPPTKSTRRSSKFKIIAVIAGVIVVASLGIGLWLGLSNQDDSKTQSLVISNLDNLKARLENLPTDPIEYKNEIMEGNWENIDDDFFTNVIKKPPIKIPLTLDAQYRITNNLEFDGNLVVAFQIRNHGASDWKSINPYTVRVYGITSMKAKTYFEGQMKKILDRSSTSGELEIVTGDLEDVKNEYFPSNVYQKPTYLSSVKVHSIAGAAIKRDGYASINFEISVPGGEKYLIPIEFKVGKDTWDAKDILENLNSDSIYKPNGASPSDWTSLDDDFFLSIIDKDKPILPSNIEIQYRIANEVINSVIVDVKDMVIEFKYRRKDINNDEWSIFSSQYSIGIFWDRNLFNTKTDLEDLPKNDITPTTDIDAVTSWQPITDEFFTNILQVTPPSFFSNIEVEYQIPEAITDDGPFITLFRFKKKDHAEWVRTFHSVNVVDLPLEKAKTYAGNFTLKDASYYFDNLDGTLSMFKSEQEITSGNINDILQLADGETYQEFSNIEIKLKIIPDETVNPPTNLTLEFIIYYKGIERLKLDKPVSKP